jgi:hypothetical protein
MLVFFLHLTFVSFYRWFTLSYKNIRTHYVIPSILPMIATIVVIEAGVDFEDRICTENGRLVDCLCRLCESRYIAYSCAGAPERIQVTTDMSLNKSDS